MGTRHATAFILIHLHARLMNQTGRPSQGPASRSARKATRRWESSASAAAITRGKRRHMSTGTTIVPYSAEHRPRVCRRPVRVQNPVPKDSQGACQRASFCRRASDSRMGTGDEEHRQAKMRESCRPRGGILSPINHAKSSKDHSRSDLIVLLLLHKRTVSDVP